MFDGSVGNLELLAKREIYRRQAWCQERKIIFGDVRQDPVGQGKMKRRQFRYSFPKGARALSVS